MWLKVKKYQEQYEKTIIELKGKASNFHKFSKIFWAKVISQPKNKQKCTAATQSMGMIDLDITSVLPWR